MARECSNCKNRIPKAIWVDGKKRNLQRRKYCLDCSPFGMHNTCRLEERKKNGKKVKSCIDCKKEHDQNGRRCFSCYFNRKTKIRKAAVSEIVGDSCWFCGYNKTSNNLCFHHVDPKMKKFGLTTRELMLKWDRVLAEMKKCVLACHNCHGEIHCGIISEKEVNVLFKKKWKSS